MTDKVTIKYNDKEYEIDNNKDEQKVKPKGEANGTEITVKDYNQGFWNHTAEIDSKKVVLKWGAGKHSITWGGGGAVIVAIALGAYYYITSNNEDKKDKTKKH